MVKKASITVFGEVQQVGFRWFVNLYAQKLNMKGFVKNNLNGTVYLEVEGEEENIKMLIDKIKIGPPTSVVDKLDIKFEKATNLFTNFLIK